MYIFITNNLKNINIIIYKMKNKNEIQKQKPKQPAPNPNPQDLNREINKSTDMISSLIHEYLLKKDYNNIL